MKHLFLLLIFIAAFTGSSCTTLKNIFKTRDPWHGRYLHHSGRFELVLNHFMDEATSVDQFELPRKENQRPRMYFFAFIEGNKAVFKSSDPTCRVEFQAIENGLIMIDRCNGTGEDDGLYKVIQ